uniref:U3 small nucleolar ribonucleoprotein protein MPP10 n=1 Tax=Saccoglossus kowalevskii TaxID=10224 RepID=A0ABM0GVH9_SACKO|nr:PREDICTED: U3 small nucleolar ribonucleoprotein protein MPP10-like [Saccoglossus kowalevskii]
MWEQSGMDLECLLSDFTTFTTAPEHFLSANAELVKSFTKLTKTLYDNTKDLEPNSLSRLIIENFDDEQIWQEIELQNEPVILDMVANVAKVFAAKDNLTLLTTSDSEEDELRDSEGEEHSDVVKAEYDGSQDLFPELNEKHFKMESSEESDSDFDDSDFEITEPKVKTKHKPQGSNIKRTEPSVVDDYFFNLADMENFLVMEDAKEERKRKKEEQHDDESEDDDEIDMFDDIPSTDEEDDADEGEKHSRDLKYQDFFDEPGDVKSTSEKKKKVKFDVAIQENMHEVDEEDFSDVKDSDSGNEIEEKNQPESSDGEDIRDIRGGHEFKPRSTYEKRQVKLKENINKLENANVGDKPWQLTGEISSTKRPDNSLLEEHLEFDHTTRPAPIITEETTLTLEQLIKQRIKDEAWDDVERKVKPKEEAFEYRKRITLDQEKSKQSLGEIYEQEYLKQNQQTAEEENKEHADINKMMNCLFLKLDALSNFQYTPKPAIPEIKIVSNIPSISMEEVAPITVSEADLLAPEEIQEKTKVGEIKGDTEKTCTDKKRERRQKKAAQHIRQEERKQRNKMVDKKNPGIGNKYSKKAALQKLEKQSKADGKTTIIKDDGNIDKNAYSSSKSFFTKLQDEVSSEIKVIKAKKKKKEKLAVTSSKLKL